MSQNGIAAELSKALHRPVRAETVPRENWGAIFRAQGMRDPIPRIQMLDGFNEGWIKFEGGGAGAGQGQGESRGSHPEARGRAHVIETQKASS